eukprot:6192413-Pleurochrysis_carterae.AAC.8
MPRNLVLPLGMPARVVDYQRSSTHYFIIARANSLRRRDAVATAASAVHSGADAGSIDVLARRTPERFM